MGQIKNTLLKGHGGLGGPGFNPGSNLKFSSGKVARKKIKREGTSCISK